MRGSTSGRYKRCVLKVVGVDQSQQRVPKQEIVVSVVEAPRHFVQIGLEMFERNLVPRPYNAALQERKRRFNGVRVNVAINVVAGTVIDSLVFILPPTALDRELIRSEVIGPAPTPSP